MFIVKQARGVCCGIWFQIMFLFAVMNLLDAQVGNSTEGLNIILRRPGNASTSTTAGGFGDEHTLALDRDTLAVGSFYSQASCGGWSGSTCPSYQAAGACDGCVLDYRMAAKLVEWSGNQDWYLAYSGSNDGFSNSLFRSRLGSSSPSIVVVYSSHLTDGTETGTYIFGGYTTKSWDGTSNFRCADSTITGGSGSTDSCHYWETCTASSDCVSLSNTCTCSSVNCDCCNDNSCVSVCSHSSDSNAYLFRLMSNSLHDTLKFSATNQGREVFICASDASIGPAFGAQGSGSGNNKPPYTDFALKLDLAARTGSTGTYGFDVPSTNWATASNTGWRIDGIEVYTIVPSSSEPRRGLFQYAPRGAGSSGDQSVHVWNRNLGGTNAWNYLKRISLPSWADSWMYGFSLALDLNTLVVGRRGNRDLYVHERHRSDCTPTGSYKTKICADRGAYLRNSWGLVQQISYPGSAYIDNSSRNIYGGVWTPASCCSPPVGTQRIQVGEWGCSVDVHGDWLIVGAYKSSLSPAQFTGAAFVYQRDYTGNFVFQAELDPAASVSYQHCGWDVALDGEYAIVGCYGSPPTAESVGVAGSVLFFERNPRDGTSTATSPWWAWGQPPESSTGYSRFPIASQWPLVAVRSASTCNDEPSCYSTTAQSSVGDFFGYSVDISGSTAIVGAFMQRSMRGDAYIYERNYEGASSDMWQLSKRIIAPDDAPYLCFGFSVSIHGSFVVITALKANDGRAYVFGRNYGGLNNWGYIQVVNQPSLGSGLLQYPSNLGSTHLWNYWSDGGGSHANGAQLLQNVPYYNSTPMIASSSISPIFGASAQIWGNTLAVGAPYADSLNTVDVGAISLSSFRPTHRQSSLEFDERTLTASQNVEGDSYGAAVHITADAKYAFVGAPRSDVSTFNQAGLVHVYSRTASGTWTEVSTSLLQALDPGDGDNFGASINSVEFRDCDDAPGASVELVIGAPGKTTAIQNTHLLGLNQYFIYPPYPRQSIKRTMPKSGSVYIFAKQNGWAFTFVTAAASSGSASIQVMSSANLMGAYASGAVTIGRNKDILVLSWTSTVLFVDNSTVLYPIQAGDEVISGTTLGQNTGFQQVEKLTALSTSCGQGGLDFSLIWDSTKSSTHTSDYSGDIDVRLQQPLTVGDKEICVNDIATLLGAHTPGGSAPFSQGDATDVIAWVKIGLNPSVAILNGVRPFATSACVPSNSRNGWSSTLPATIYYVVPIASQTVSSNVAVLETVYKAPLYSISSPYTACLDGEYIASGRVNAGSSVVASSASGGSGDTLNCATGTLLPQCLTASAGLPTAYDIGTSSLTVKSAIQMFQAVSLGVVQTSSSSTTFNLESTASDVAGWYVGFDITVDLDANLGTTSDVCTSTITAYQSSREVTVEAGCTQPTAMVSIYTISRWRSRKYICTGPNLQITVTNVNFGTNELTVSGVVWPGSVGEAVYQTVPNKNEIQLDESSPIIDSLYNLCFISIVQGKGAGQKNLITSYRGQTRIASTASDWIIPPDATSEYIITGKPLCNTNLGTTIDGPVACEGDGFGFSTAVGRQTTNRHVMAIGAPWANSHQHCSSYPPKTYGPCTTYRAPLYQGGRVYLFERLGNGTSSRWRLSRILEAPSAGGLSSGSIGSPGALDNQNIADVPSHAAASYDRFGYSVAILNDQIFVGAPWSGIDDSGAVFIFERNYVVIMRGIVSCSLGCSLTNFSIGVSTRQNWDVAPGSPSIIAGSYVGCKVTVGNPPKQETREIMDYAVSGWKFNGIATISVSFPFSSVPDEMTNFRIHSGDIGKCGLLNNWGFKQTIVGSSRRPSDFLGWSLAATNAILIVGVPGYDVPFASGAGRLRNKLTDAGGVFVFEHFEGSIMHGCEQPRWSETQILTQTSDTSVDSNIVSRLGSSVTIDRSGSTIVAGAPLHDGDSFRSATESSSQRVGWLGSSGAIVIFRKQSIESSTYAVSDFDPTYRAETIRVLVDSVQTLLGNSTSGTVSIGENQAIQIIDVDSVANVLITTAATVLFSSKRVALGLPPVRVVRNSYWRKDQAYIPSTAVAFGKFGHSVSMWADGVCFVGAPNGESEVACCGNTSDVQIRAGTAHAFNLAHLRPSIDNDGAMIESGTIANVTDSITFALAITAPNFDDAYYMHSLMINSQERLIVQYTGKFRMATVQSPFSSTPVAGTTTYTISSPIYSSSTILNSKSDPGLSCRDLMERGFKLSGNYWLEPSYSQDCKSSMSAFVGYCDQESDGGGWLMCYTEDSQVDIAHEYGYRASKPFGKSGYRADCRNTPFNEVMYVYHFDIPAFQNFDHVTFRAEGRRPITASLHGWHGSAAHDIYGNLTFTATSPYSVPTNSYPYQLNICGNGYGCGFVMSGLISTSTCSTGWKSCDNWCDDVVSDYYRHAYSPKKNAMNGIPVNFTGVSFQENGHKSLGRRLMSVGIRNKGFSCMSGWSGDGVHCSCPVIHSLSDVVSLWRFENGIDTATPSDFIQDVSRRTPSIFSADTRVPGLLGSGTMSTTTMNNDLEFVAPFSPSYTTTAPRNETFAVLCIQNQYAMQFSSVGSSFLQSVPYASMNHQSLSSFTWELSVYFDSLAGQQTFISWHNNAGNYSMSIFKLSNNNLGFSVSTKSGIISAVSRMSFEVAKWYHIAVTYNGEIAGMIRLWHLDTGGSIITASDCADSLCQLGSIQGRIGRRGGGLGNGVTLFARGYTSGCAQGMMLSAVGGGKCSVSSSLAGSSCIADTDCGIAGKCFLGSGFSAVISAVNATGAIAAIIITNPGLGYQSVPNLIVDSANCACNGQPGNIIGNLDSCMRALPSNGSVEVKDHWVLESEVAWPSMEGWAYNGNTLNCSKVSLEPCPFSASPTEPGWRWSIGRSGNSASPSYFSGIIDEIRISPRAIDLATESLWRP